MSLAKKILSALSAFVMTISLWGIYNYLTDSFSETQKRVEFSSFVKANLVEDLAKQSRSTVLSPISIQKEAPKSQPSTLLKDPTMKQLWSLEKTDTERAWKISQGSRDVVVAIIDTGADISHPDLNSAIWTNPGESGKDEKGRDRAKNQIDDDQNGFIDDVHGWNFVANNNNVSDGHGHGSHVAGIIGASGKGVHGIAPKSSLMILKYYDPKAVQSNNLANTVAAIRYAVKMKAQIINYSGGGVDYSNDEFNAVKEARNAGVLFVAAAGNERANSDKDHYYPANYKLDNIISVTAIDPNLKVLPSSNYGTDTVDIAAPGENIYSTFPNNSYGSLTGTSQATAFVTGVAALVLAAHKDFSASDIRKHILATGDFQDNLLAKTQTARRLNSYKALAISDFGFGLTGVKALNLQGVGARTFSGDAQPLAARGLGEAQADDMLAFGQDLAKKINKSAASKLPESFARKTP